MLTPFFEISQTNDEINIMIRAPLANVANTELTAIDDLIVFYSSPYYLRLHLPGKVIEREGDTGEYICDKQEFRFTLKKLNPGEQFEDLDMIGKLLEPSKKFQIKPEINICDDSEVVPSSDPESDDELLGYIKQQIVPDRTDDLPKYGFANKGQGLGKNLRYEFREILDFVDIENTSTEDRSLLREAEELAKFSEDHYLADLMEPEEINSLLLWEPLFYKDDPQDKFTQEEKDLLRSFGNRDYLLDQNEKKVALFSLVDILFAYAYDHRTTLAEESVESAWTINKLSATLSWLQSFKSMREVKIACARRSLIFPLYRNWELTLAVFKDTSTILKKGRRWILKCLLDIHTMFNASEPRYLLNQLYITDYCIWLQKISEKTINQLSELFDETIICKNDLRLELNELEEAALLVKEEEELQIVDRMMGVTLSDSVTDDSEDESDESTETASSSEIESSTDTDSSLESDSDSSDESTSLDSDDLSSEELLIR